MDCHLKDQVALVTGASRGIGKAIAGRLGRSGAFVAGTATTENGAAGIEEFFKETGIAGRGFILDIGANDSVAQLGELLKAASITPSILVNNAGITRDNLMLRMKQQEWDEVINTNLNAVYRLSKLCLRNMIKARYGRIINITSVVALSGNPGQTNYVAAKSGIIGFSRALAKETGSRGITVNCIAPGFIDTDMTANLPDRQREQLLEQIPLGRLGLADDIAYAAEFIASPAAGYITGEVLNVNGGYVYGMRGCCIDVFYIAKKQLESRDYLAYRTSAFGLSTGRRRLYHMSNVEERVMKIIVEQLGVKEEEVTSEASFVDDLGADSLDTVELVMALEEEFKIEIPDEDAEKITTVQQAIDYIDTHLE